MKEKWMIETKKADFKEIAGRFQIDQVTARLVRNRDIIGDEAIQEYLYGGKECLHAPQLMKDMELAVKYLAESIQKHRHIRVIGDYDIDGICATYILLCGLRECKAKVDHVLPDRILDGYGLNISLIDRALADGVETIITCDNGISAFSQVEYARKQGLTVIITDHHELKSDEAGTAILPEADAVVNPHRPDCPYPYKQLCGAGVAYKVIRALYEALGKAGEESNRFIEFAGFATVGDIMELTGENRILVKEALKLLNQTENPGLRALMRVNEVEGKKITASHIGFTLGPCMNASGRLATAEKSLQLLLAETEGDALPIAQELLELNARRKDLTEQGIRRAAEEIEANGWEKDRVLVVYLPECHESIAGIIAGKIRDRYYRPTYILTDGANSIKGSGRSIEGYFMSRELEKVQDLFSNFGGHPMAAGFSLKERKVEEMRRRLNEVCSLTDEQLCCRIMIDVPMPLHYISEKVIEELSLLEPFGKGNKKPVFAEKALDIQSLRIIGKNQNVIKMRVRNEMGCVMDALCFQNTEKLLKYIERVFGVQELERLKQGRENRVYLSLMYYPQINEFRDERTIQIIVESYA
ncbi:MAG: single-stranded-DNA-specific exonuclease RecJ [Eubacteriales bacterium]|nr:single-stranded-DNA-specific exonuclease RecJ [Eubacteriales bacterium]